VYCTALNSTVLHALQRKAASKNCTVQYCAAVLKPLNCGFPSACSRAVVFASGRSSEHAALSSTLAVQENVRLALPYAATVPLMSQQLRESRNEPEDAVG
jgi:hypothetical protein